MKTNILIFLLLLSALYVNAQSSGYDKLINEALIAKDTSRAAAHLVEKLKVTDPSKSTALEILGTNNQIFNILFKYSNQKTQLLTAAAYLEKLLALKPEKYQGNLEFQANYIDTYANIIYKAGKVRRAIDWEKKAVAHAFKNQKAEFEANLEKMEKGRITW